MIRLDIQMFGGRGASSSSENIKNVQRTLNKVESSKDNLNYEIVDIIDKNGKIILSIQGQEHQVNVPENQRKQMKDKIITHNHPTNFNLATQDIETFLQYDIKEIRASTKNVIYSLSKKNNSNKKAFNEALKKDKPGDYQKAYKEFGEKLKRGEVSRNFGEVLKIQSDNMSKWLKQNASKYNYSYKEIRR